MPRQKITDDKKRVPGISIKLNTAEKKTIEEKAAAHSVKPSTYLRNLGLNYPIKVTVDQAAVKDLLKVNADLGRLGGLFKLWLSENTVDKLDFSNNRSYKNIDDLVDEIERTQTAMKEIALSIMLENK
jgi:hypothetical protein